MHRRDTLRATKIYHAPLTEAPNVEFLWDSAVTQLHHNEKLTGITVRHLPTQTETFVPADGVFVSIGRNPNTQLVQKQLTLDESGYIIADESTRTSIPGVFAVGDVRAKALRQIVTAVTDGAVAAHFAEEHLANIN